MLDKKIHHILIISNNVYVRDVLTSFLREKGFNVTLASDVRIGLPLLRAEKCELFLIDLGMTTINILDTIKETSNLHVKTPVIVITDHGNVNVAVDAVKTGAFDYIIKPFVIDEVMLIISRALSISSLKDENLQIKRQLKRKYNFNGLISDSPKMLEVFYLIDKVADSDSTVLITGESGTGKELVAKTIHNNSSFAQGPFVPLNCAAIPKDLLESELFGHEKGAFTGALNTRIGRFELAHNGTLFLDEIGELDPSLQVKLLRVLQEKEFERVGGVKTIKIDVRILAASNKDLEKATREGKFREDLFYRLNVIPIHIPPLRDRAEDIPLLVDHFVQEFTKSRKREPLTFTSEAMECLLKYRWPGNVRELENLIERLTVLSSGSSVKVLDLPKRLSQDPITQVDIISNKLQSAEHNKMDIAVSDGGVDFNEIVEKVERDLVLNALEKTGWIKKRAAKLLGLNRTTLTEKMKKMGIEQPQIITNLTKDSSRDGFLAHHPFS